MRLRKRTWEIIETAKRGDMASRVFDIFILSLIFLNVVAVVLDSVSSIETSFGGVLKGFEVFSVAVFTVEYCLRLWSCVTDPRYSNPVAGRLRFALTPLAIIDLLAVAPFYVALMLPSFGVDLRFMRVVRLMRLFRIAKVGRYSSALKTISRVVSRKKEELVVSLTLLVLLLVFSSSLMYYIENPAQPQTFSSIPATMWWAVITLTTVGYGDIYPVTPLGKLLTTVVAILGIALFALPAGIIASGFVEEIQTRAKSARCPHCGKEIP